MNALSTNREPCRPVIRRGPVRNRRPIGLHALWIAVALLGAFGLVGPAGFSQAAETPDTIYVNCDDPCPECVIDCPVGCTDNCPLNCICPSGCTPGAPDCPTQCLEPCPAGCTVDCPVDCVCPATCSTTDCPLSCREPCEGNCPGDGSLAKPFDTIRTALVIASPGDTVQVLPTDDECDPLANPPIPCACVENVIMVDGVDLIGSGAPSTTIQGDGAESVVIMPTVNQTRLEGFTITGGGGEFGAGVRGLLGTPVITRNVITGNTAEGTLGVPFPNPGRGGGLYLYATAATVYENKIVDNIAGVDAGGLGGGVFVRLGTPLISRNLIQGNIARGRPDAYSYFLFGYGGGLELQGGSPGVVNNLITGNYAGIGGGGIDVYGGAPFISNNTIDGNCGGFTGAAADCLTGASPPPAYFSYGGGIEIVTATAPAIFNNLITNNIAQDGGGGVDVFPVPGPPELRFAANDVFGNEARADPTSNEYLGLQVCTDASANPGRTCLTDADCSDDMITGTCQTTGATGVAGNISEDPLYANPAGGDYSLAGASPAVDSGRDGLREYGPGPDGIEGTPDDELTFIAPLTEEDLEGRPRSLDFNPAPPVGTDPTADNADMGALESQRGPDGDADADGILEDGDGSGEPGDNPCTGGATTGCDDNCPTVFNPGQGDSDGDGVGNFCDVCPSDADPDQEDLDRDLLGNECDPDQDNDQVLEDGDGSGVAGDNPCTGGATTDCDDNCPLVANSTQIDTDGDGIGDNCDCAPNDPDESSPAGEIGDTLVFGPGSSTLVEWGDPGNADTYNLYRGDLLTLRDLCQYTQDPALVLDAAQFCALTETSQDDPFEPGSGLPVFYLVTAVNACGETTLGEDSSENLRENEVPCP